MKNKIGKTAAGIVSLLLATVICFWGFTPVSVKAADKSTTSDTTIKVGAANALAVMAEMLGANVVSSSQTTLETNEAAKTMPEFLTSFGVASNNVNGDPWIINYNTSAYAGSDASNYGWDGYSGSELKPISNAKAGVLPTEADSLKNKPDIILQFPVADDTTTANSNNYYGVNGEGFNNANTAMGNTNTVDYVVTNNLPTPTDIKNTISNIADHFETLVKNGKTGRYGDPKAIADSFNSYYDANEAKAKDVTSSLTKKNIIHITAYNANTKVYTVIPTSQNDIYGTTYIQDAGGNNVAAGTTMTSSQIADALGDNGAITTINRTLYDDITDDQAIASIPHYIVPTGVYLWSVRSPEGALCSLWLASVLHGGETVTYNGARDTVANLININKVAYDFYKNYYHYNATDTATNKLSDVISGDILSPATGSSKILTKERMGGADRYATSVAISSEKWNTSDTAVLVSGQAFADALSAAPLAKKYNAPILLTPTGTLNSGVSAELKRLKVKKVYIIGGEGSVSPSVEDTIKSMGMDTTRIGGADRYDTSLLVAKQVGTNPSQIIMASGTGYADGLSGSSYAALSASPILLINGKNISGDELSYVKDSNAKVYALGGDGVMADSVVSSTGAERISGADRYATNLAVLNKFSSNYDLSNLYVASGNGFADALSGSAAAGMDGSPVLLVSPNKISDAKTYVDDIIPRLYNVNILGGTGVVSDSTVSNILK